MRIRLLVVGVVALVAVALWVRSHDNLKSPQKAERAATAENGSVATSSLAAASPHGASSPRGSALPQPFTPPDEAALIEADKVSLMIRDYRTLAGENPVGTNAEIMKAVMGGNPKEANLGPPEGMTLNENGELIDRWGTPYFFHQLSRDQMEIRSAGADKIMWTEDDPIVK